MTTNSIFTTLCSPVSLPGGEKPLRDLTFKEAESFVGLCIMEQNLIHRPEPSMVFNNQRAIELGFPGLVLFDRLSWSNLSISLPMAAWITMVSRSPGEIVMWAWTLRDIILSKGVESKSDPMSLQDWADRFPMGLPSQAMFDYVWESQKVSSAPNGNGLDDIRVWKSITA